MKSLTVTQATLITLTGEGNRNES